MRTRSSLVGSAGLAAVACITLFGLAGTPARAQIQNPISAFPIEADGAYTTTSEWTDVTPAWFISDPSGGANPTFVGDPNANSLLFAGLARDNAASNPELYLMYDYLPRTTLPTKPGEIIGSVSFPLSLVGGSNAPVSKVITVEFVAPANLGTPGAPFFEVKVNTQDGQGFVAHPELGLEAGVGFGVTPASIVGAASPFHTIPHELIELGVPLDIPAGFGTVPGPFPPGGQSGPGGNGYSPDPAYGGSHVTDNSGDPPASGGLFTISPNGSTAIVPNLVPAIPPSPVLTLVHSAGNNVKLSWPEAAMGFTLQSTLNLGSPLSWHAVSPTPVISSLQNVVTTPTAGSRQFYRLFNSVTNH